MRTIRWSILNEKGRCSASVSYFWQELYSSRNTDPWTEKSSLVVTSLGSRISISSPVHFTIRVGMAFHHCQSLGASPSFVWCSKLSAYSMTVPSLNYLHVNSLEVNSVFYQTLPCAKGKEKSFAAKYLSGIWPQEGYLISPNFSLLFYKMGKTIIFTYLLYRVVKLLCSD